MRNANSPRPARVRAAAIALWALTAVPLAAVPLVAVAPIAPAEARAAPDSFADLAARLLPAVVNISSSSVVHAEPGAPGAPGAGPEVPMFPPGSPFEQFFKDFLDRNRRGGQPNPHQQEPERRTQSLGSGFIIAPSGVIVTNNHVIDGADEITVTLQDNTSLKAKLIGRDLRSDLAVLQVKADHPLPSVPFADSDTARVGDWVLAIGNPFGLGGTVTAGIVSARGRDIHQGPYDDFIQTDAAINRGNSGGPLFDMSGAVIGINTAIYSPSGGSIGIGFSIPSNMAKNVVAQLRQYGHARRGWLGVRIQQVTPDIAESLGLKDTTGAMVAGVNKGGPADQASIHNGDVVLTFNGQTVKDMHGLPLIVAETPIGQSVPVVLWRDGKDVTVQAKVGELPPEAKLASAEPEAAKPAAPDSPVDVAGLGLRLMPLSADARQKLQLGADQKGVQVAEVTPNGAAADRGLKAGDVVLEVQQQQVASPADVLDRIAAVRKQGRKSVLMLIQGPDGLRWVPLALDAGDSGKPG